MGRDLKICLVTHDFLPNFIGGRQKHVYCLAKELGKLGLKVEIFTGDTVQRITKEVISKNISVTRFPMYQIPIIKHPNKIYYKFVPSMFRPLMKIDADLIHAHDYFHFTSDLSALTTKLTKKPFVLSIHGFYWHSTLTKLLNIVYSRSIGQFTLNHAKKVIFMSKFSANEFKDRIDANKIEVINPGIDTDIDIDSYLNSDIPLKKKLGIKNEKIVLAIGRILKEKGFQHLITALPDIAKTFPNLKVVIVGPDGGYKKELGNLASRLGVEKYIIFAGRVSDEEIHEALAMADIFVLPSKFENFPEILLLAMYFKKPVVASDVGGVPEFVENGKDGLLFEVGNAEQLSNAIIALLTDENLSGYLKNNAHKKAAKDYPLEKMAEKSYSVYEEILGI